MQRNFGAAVETYSAGSLVSYGRAQNVVAPPALWHLLKYSDLQKVTKGHISSVDSMKKLGGWGCSTRSVERLDTYAVWNGLVAPNGLLDHRIEEIWSIVAILADLGLHASYGSSERQ